MADKVWVDALKISKWFKWSINDLGSKGLYIRRYRLVNGKQKWTNYPRHKYRDYSVEQIELLVKRLNATRESAELQAKKRYEFDCAYCSPTVIREFEAVVRKDSSVEKHVTTVIGYLQNHILNFFVRREKLIDPNAWKLAENEFGIYLLEQKLSAASIVCIVQIANRFLKHLYYRFPNEIRPVKLHVLGKKKLADLSAKSDNVDRIKLISAKDWTLMLQSADAILKPAMQLSYFLGLRRAESLALVPDDVLIDCVSVHKQVLKVEPIVMRGSLKSRDKRFVPYWFCTPELVYELVSQLQIVHPDTLSDRFETLMAELGLKYQFHDLRRTFITHALRLYQPRDVQMAAGHANLRTTMLYAQDDRQLQKQKFVPGLRIIQSDK